MKAPPGLLPALVVLATVAAGCASAKKNVGAANSERWYSVSAEETPFYHYGPQQANGPDLQLPKDSIMKVIRPSFGYVKVQLQSGQSGYVATEDIAPASSALVAEKLAPPPPPPPPIFAGTGEEFQLDSNDPRLIPPPEPLPEPSPSPAFRY